MRPALKGRVQTEIRVMQGKLKKAASLENPGKNLLPKVPPVLLSHVLSSFLSSKETAALQTACVGDGSLNASRFHRLNAFSQAIEQNRAEIPVLFQELHKDDRARILAKFNIDTFDWAVMQRSKEPLQKEIEAMKTERSFILRSSKLRANHIRKFPVGVMSSALNQFLSPTEIANLQQSYKNTPTASSSAASIIKIYHLEPFIKTYLHLSCKDLNKNSQAKALKQLMSMVQELSKIEQLEVPSYRSIGEFFKLIEARNLLRMAAQMHRNHPLIGLKNEQLKIAKDSATTLQRAEAVRSWLGEHQESLQGLVKLDFRDCNLTLLPPEIGQFRSLTSLYLMGNHLPSLTKEIGQLGALTYLEIHGNRLSSLPKEIGQLRALHQLLLGYNHLTRLPKEIGQLKVLNGLMVHNNRLTSLPKEMAQLTALVSSAYRENGILEFPPGLKLDGNKLKHQNKKLQLQNIVRQLLACFDKKHDIKRLGQLMGSLEKIFGKETRRRLHKCLFEVAQEKAKTDKSLQKKLKDPHFGRNGFLDKSVKPQLKAAAIAKFWKVMEPKLRG